MLNPASEPSAFELVSSAPAPAPPSFSGHETFVFRYTWLKKGVDALSQNPNIFRDEDAIVHLGVGKNMVNSIRHWGLATGVFEEITLPGQRIRPLRVSEIGRLIFADGAGWDEFLEDDATLWALHYQLSTNTRRAPAWVWAFHRLREGEFTRDTLLKSLENDVERYGWGKPSPSSLKADVSCFLRTYLQGRRGVASTAEETLDCPLATLGLLLAPTEENPRYRFNNRSKPTLPPHIFAFALASFWRARAGQNTLSLREITYGDGSPGRAFRLDEDGVLPYLDALADITGGMMRFADTALTRQVSRSSQVDPLTVLKSYYAR